MTSEQLEVARAERMRQNGLGTLTFEDARTWIEETGLCHFLPRRQSVVAPSFVEAVGGRPDAAPDPKRIALAEEILVRLEAENIAVRLNLLGQPGEHPDYVVASWVLPYVYALRGDRDWRRNPQLTGSRAVSPLAVQAYKLLEAGDATIPQLKLALGREVTEAAVLRAITELWQQLRIIPVIASPGQTAKWQLLRHRYQKAIAEGASTSQVTAISVLASIFLQAVIAAAMEEVEIFLSPLTARSKVREVLRGLVATRQVHTISLGHAPHFYVAGTLPDFTAIPSVYAAGNATSSSFGLNGSSDRVPFATPRFAEPVYPSAQTPREQEFIAEPAPHRSPDRIPASAGNGRSVTARPHSHPAPHGRDRKPHAQPTNGNRMARRGGEARVSAAGGSRWVKNLTAHSNGNGKSNGSHAPRTGEDSSGAGRNGKPAWSKHNGHHTHAKNGKEGRAEVRTGRKSAFTGAAKAGKAKRLGLAARRAQGSKKRG